jgi:hypothetical protein
MEEDRNGASATGQNTIARVIAKTRPIEEPWKSPLLEFLENLYFKRFEKRRPETIRSIEQIKSDSKKSCGSMAFMLSFIPLRRYFSSEPRGRRAADAGHPFPVAGIISSALSTREIISSQYSVRYRCGGSAIPAARLDRFEAITKPALPYRTPRHGDPPGSEALERLNSENQVEHRSRHYHCYQHHPQRLQAVP